MFVTELYAHYELLETLDTSFIEFTMYIVLFFILHVVCTLYIYKFVEEEIVRFSLGCPIHCGSCDPPYICVNEVFVFH